MAILAKSKRLKKELSLFSVYAIATGTTLSAGFFLLPGLAAREAGNTVVLSYIIAAAFLVPAMLSIVELATAMPRAGGAYYFLDRSLGPLAGTIGGLGTWLALVMKVAFALVGMGAYLALLLEAAGFTGHGHWTFKFIAAGLAIGFGLLNLYGAKRAGSFQIVLVLGLLAILAWFISHGSLHLDPDRFHGFFDKESFRSTVSTAGLVFISYVGVTNIASISEEVKNPERNLPLGIFLALGTSVVVYALGIWVMVGSVDMAELTDPDMLTPIADAAKHFAHPWGPWLVSVAALMAFASVANAGILSASRYPLAMSRDHIVPGFFGKLSGRGMPTASIVVTVGAILVLLLLDPTRIAKFASAFQLLMFAMICLAVIVMRESGLESYDPGYRSPLYPWTQLVGIVAPVWLITRMGWEPTLLALALVGLGIGWYFGYARARVKRHGAIYHVFERLGRRRFVGLDSELRSILKEKGLRAEDPFEVLVARASVIVARRRDTFQRIVERAARQLAERLPCTSDTLAEGFLQGTRIGATPVTGGVALPHLRISGIDSPQMVLVRCQHGMRIETGDVFGALKPAENTYAIFFLVSPDRDPGQHLRLLAELAGRVEQEGFIDGWRMASDEQTLKEILLRDDRFVSIPVVPGTRSEVLAGKAIQDMQIPDGCLVAIIRRQGETLVPHGSTVVEAGDWLTIIGATDDIRHLREMYGMGQASGTSGEGPEPVFPSS
ncbi:MAG: amino acid permease [Planctomycetes bacterium]|nr:amino acid permease [Planctomycetota bacterium]